MERGFSAVMHELLYDLRPELIAVFLDPSDAEDRAALEQLAGAARASPILVLSPTTEDSAVLAALELGADVCLSAESSAEVVAAQGTALVRRWRERAAPSEPAVVRLRDLTIDFDRRRVSRGANVLELTRTEFDILGMLARNPGRVVSASEILASVGQYARSEAQARVIVKVHLSHLRQKIEAGGSGPYIETIRGVGYLLERREPNDVSQADTDDAPPGRVGTA
jgi:two-component system OmpR family response regulator